MRRFGVCSSTIVCRAAFYLGEEAGILFTGIVMNHQIPETQTVIEAVRTRLEPSRNNALNSVEFHHGKTGT